METRLEIKTHAASQGVEEQLIDVHIRSEGPGGLTILSGLHLRGST